MKKLYRINSKAALVAKLQWECTGCGNDITRTYAYDARSKPEKCVYCDELFYVNVRFNEDWSLVYNVYQMKDEREEHGR